MSKIWKNSFVGDEIRVLMVGLYFTGKQTILNRLNLGNVVTKIPSIGFIINQVKYRNISLTSWDVGDSLYKDQFNYLNFKVEKFQALIFVVDSYDRDRIQLSRETLHKLLNQERLSDIELLVFANKQDLPGALSVAEVTDQLELNSIRGRNWFIQGSCAIRGNGLYEGFDWLSRVLSAKNS